jgi:bifunctional non-homologous end joining protein LigD
VQLRFGEHVVACTNTDRVVFPEVGVTKGDVIAYYRDVAEVMVPELRGRPLTLERFTKGLTGGGFYQKHRQKHFPAWIDHVVIDGKTRVDYPICDTPASLVYFANQGALALHVMTTRKASLARPDVLVIDLDPPAGGFELARRAARLVGALLDELGLTAFVKTTGSKGLHVIAPLDGRDGFDQVARLGSAIAAHLCERHPDLVTTEFYKKDRGGRLFLDTMRNTPGATFVAAYSLRGKPTAPVSAPIEWDELDDPGLRPDGFTVRDLRARLEARGDPWHELRARPGSASDAWGILAG